MSLPPPDGSFGIEEFRRDTENGGRWTQIRYFSGAVYASWEAALASAACAVAWLGDQLGTGAAADVRRIQAARILARKS